MNETLLEFTNRYILENNISFNHAQSYLRHVNAFLKWAERPLLLSELSDDLVNRWLVELQNRNGRHPKTLNDYRGSLLCLWRRAFQDGLLPAPPRRIRKMRVPKRAPVAWSLEELTQLVKTAEGMHGCCPKSSIPYCVFFPALIHFKYETGFRISDVLSVQRAEMVGCVVPISQQKTGQVIYRAIYETTLEKLKEVWRFSQNDARALPWMVRINSLYYHFRELVKTANIPPRNVKILAEKRGIPLRAR